MAVSLLSTECAVLPAQLGSIKSRLGYAVFGISPTVERLVAHFCIAGRLAAHGNWRRRARPREYLINHLLQHSEANINRRPAVVKAGHRQWVQTAALCLP